LFEARFPGQYIAEYIAQTRAWFYYMHVVAVLLFDNISFENVVTTGTIMNEKGEKLSKSKQNYTDPWIIIKEYGVDALRYYLMTSVVMQAENLFFSDREVRDVYNKIVNILWNVVEFYSMYETTNSTKDTKLKFGALHILDQWILARLNELVREVTMHMDAYDTVRAGRPIKEFIDDLSTWYVRRSRDRFKSDNEEERAAAFATLRQVLLTLSKVMAPFMPFIAEQVWQRVTGNNFEDMDRSVRAMLCERRCRAMGLPTMFGLGTTEIVVILAIVVILFGGRKLPQLGRGLAEGIRNFRLGLRKEEDSPDSKKNDEAPPDMEKRDRDPQ